MTTIAIAPRSSPPRNGVISALIVSVGMAVMLGAAVGHIYLRKDLTLTVGGRTVSHTSYRAHSRTGAGGSWRDAPANR